MEQIKFDNLGRENYSGSIPVDTSLGLSAEDIAAFAYGEAVKHLMSRDVQCVYDSKKNEGLVFAGFHKVGKFTVVGG